MPNLNFRVRVEVVNPEVLPELQARMQDLRPAFQNIFSEWVDINAQKFELAAGHEESGAQIFEEFWQGLSEGYMTQKHGGGTAKVTKKVARGGDARFAGAFPNWLMVRTGALREAMTHESQLFSRIDEEEAVFGSPEDPELADIVRWQGERRPVVFLSLPDMNAIRRNLQDYFSLGGNYKDIRFAKGLSFADLKNEVGEMDAEFTEQAGSFE